MNAFLIVKVKVQNRRLALAKFQKAEQCFSCQNIFNNLVKCWLIITLVVRLVLFQRLKSDMKVSSFQLTVVMPLYYFLKVFFNLNNMISFINKTELVLKLELIQFLIKFSNFSLYDKLCEIFYLSFFNYGLLIINIIIV